MVRHRHRRAHAAQLRMLRRFLEDACVGLVERRLELREDSLRFGSVRVKEPLERVERELLDRDDGKGARLFAGAVPAHAVGHEKQVSAFLPELRLRLRQARLPDAHRLGEFGDEELILIGRPHAALVGDAEGLHRQRTVSNLRDGLVLHREIRFVHGARVVIAREANCARENPCIQVNRPENLGGRALSSRTQLRAPPSLPPRRPRRAPCRASLMRIDRDADVEDQAEDPIGQRHRGQPCRLGRGVA